MAKTEPPMDGRYYAKGSRIFKAPKSEAKEGGGKTVSLGFPVLDVTEFVGTDGVSFIVDALNKHEGGHSGCFCPHCNPQPSN